MKVGGVKAGAANAADVAALAGVSRSAVSRVFTPGASVSTGTAQKVREAAVKLGYRPNVLARSLNTGRSRIIGLVVAYLDNHFYPDALERLSKALQAEGYHVLVFMASNGSENTDAVLEEILGYQVDGIIAASASLSSHLAERCRELGVPVVLFNRTLDLPNVAAVTSDNLGGGHRLGELLLAGGHARIAHIAGWEGASTQRDREAGFMRALAEGGRRLHARGVGGFNAERARQAAREMFAGPDRPDAVFVANDHMAFAVMDVLRFELGLRIPQDVSVVGYDDTPPAAWPSFSLTTIRQRAATMVEHTVALLMDEIATPGGTSRHVSVDAPLILRGSARIPKGWTP